MQFMIVHYARARNFKESRTTLRSFIDESRIESHPYSYPVFFATIILSTCQNLHEVITYRAALRYTNTFGA